MGRNGQSGHVGKKEISFGTSSRLLPEPCRSGWRDSGKSKHDLYRMRSHSAEGDCLEMKSQIHSLQSGDALPLNAYPPLSLDQFMRQSGLSPASCWRYRKRGWLRTVVIANRHYVTREAIAEFNDRATRGEFAGTIPNPSAASIPT